MKPNTPPPSIFEIDSRLTLIPVVNASAPFATALRRELLKRPFDALAVALPKSFANPVIEAVEQLPNLSFVALSLSDQNTTYRDSVADPETEDSLPLATYVPIDPCQAVIAAIRFALGEHIPIAWVGSDSPPFDVTLRISQTPTLFDQLPSNDSAPHSFPLSRLPHHRRNNCKSTNSPIESTPPPS